MRDAGDRAVLWGKRMRRILAKSLAMRKARNHSVSAEAGERSPWKMPRGQVASMIGGGDPKERFLQAARATEATTEDQGRREMYR